MRRAGELVGLFFKFYFQRWHKVPTGKIAMLTMALTEQNIFYVASQSLEYGVLMTLTNTETKNCDFTVIIHPNKLELL